MSGLLAVFIDYQNALLTGRDCFAPGAKPWTCAPDPVRLSQRVMRKMPGADLTLSQVNVYRGHPDPRKEKLAASTSDRQKASWERDQRVKAIRRSLTYRQWPHLPPIEKGVDVKLAVDLVHAALQGTFTKLLVFSSDTDLEPAIELAEEVGALVDSATWVGANPLACNQGCHRLSREDWKATVTDWS